MTKYLFLLCFLLTQQVFAKQHIILNNENSILLNDYVTDVSVNNVIQKAIELDTKPTKEPIYLVLYTGGGSIKDGVDLINVLKNLKRPVHTIVVHAYSMGFIITQSLNKRYIVSNGDLMAHPASGSFSGEFPGQVTNQVDFWVKKINSINSTVAERVGKTLEQVTALFDNEYWCSDVNCLKDGFVDEIVTVSCDSTLTSTYIKQTPIPIGVSSDNKLYKIIYEEKFSRCPMSPKALETDVYIVENNGALVSKVPKELSSKLMKIKQHVAAQNSTKPKSWLEKRDEPIIILGE